jgi:pyruvate kinase
VDAEGLRHLIAIAVEGGFDGTRITLDLQGGKTRIRGLEGALEVRAGQEILLVPSPRGRQRLSLPTLPVDRPEFLEALEPEDTVRVDDGRVTLQVVEVGGAGIRARFLGDGQVADRKGLALVGREVALPPRLLDNDRALVTVALDLGIETVAVSYAATPGVLRAAQEATGRSLALVAKLEQPEALERVEDLLAASDALWLCRGDLGAEVGLARLPALQRRLLDATLGRAPVLVAGQVLHHMTASPRPTRSEVCHVADLLERGVAGFVLSDETAAGPHGPEAVRWLRRIADEV